MKRKEDRSRASLRSAASERKPLKINSEKGKRNEGRRGVLRRTKSRTFWLGMGARVARSPHPHVDTVAPGEGALSGPHICIPLHPYVCLLRILFCSLPTLSSLQFECLMFVLLRCYCILFPHSQQLSDQANEHASGTSCS